MNAHEHRIRCSKCAGSLAVIICAAGSALAIYSNDAAKKKEEAVAAEKAALIAATKGKVAVFLTAKSSRRDELVVEAEVTNYTDAAVDWDSKFAVPLNWEIRSDSQLPVIGSPQPGGLRLMVGSRDRFMRLLPGEKLVKEIELTRGLRHFVYGHYTFGDENGGFYHRPMGYEEAMTFEIPKGAKSLTVRLTWNKPISNFAAGFHVCFGIDPKNLSLAGENLWSNVLTIDLER